MDRRRYPWYIGIGCGLLLLILLVPLSFAAMSIGLRALIPDTSSPPISESNQLTPIPQNERFPPATPQGADPRSERVPESDAPPFDTDLTALYEQVNPGVVNISTQVTGEGQFGQGAGSGFIIDESGYIVTNNHVVLGANTVIVGFYNGLEARAEVIGTDPYSDLAILEVAGIPEGAHALPLGDSELVRVGQRVVAIGNPFQLGSTMTYGIVSAVGRVIPSGFTRFSIPKAIQTDAAINPGNSGGPLLNLQGEVIGVNAQIETGGTGIRGNLGIGFAIPSNILSLVANDLVETGSYSWPWLGASGLAVSEMVQEANDLETQEGAYIALVVPESPAGLAGLQGSTGQAVVDGIPVPTGGDVVLAYNGEIIANFDQLLTAVAFAQPGEEIILTVLRDGEQIELPVVLAERPQNMAIPPELNPEQTLPPGHP